MQECFNKLRLIHVDFRKESVTSQYEGTEVMVAVGVVGFGEVVELLYRCEGGRFFLREEGERMSLAPEHEKASSVPLDGVPYSSFANPLRRVAG
jgi:hypothetical protein